MKHRGLERVIFYKLESVCIKIYTHTVQAYSLRDQITFNGANDEEYIRVQTHEVLNAVWYLHMH